MAARSSDLIGASSFVRDFDEATTCPCNIFEKPYVDYGISQGFTQEYFPVNSLTNEGPYEFQVPSAGEGYIYLPFTRLHGSFKIQKIDSGTLKDCVDADDYSVTNNFVSNLFSKIEVSVNGTEVVDQSLSLYGYKSYLETLLSYGKESKETFLKTSGFMKDQPSTCKYNVAPASKDTASWKNSGYFLRQGAVSASKEFFFVTDLHSGFLRSSRYLPPGVNLKIRLIRANDSFTLMYKTGEYKILIKNLKLSVRRVTLNPSIFTKHMKNFESGIKAILPFKQSHISTVLLPQGSREHNVVLARGHLPTQIILGYVNADSFSGNTELNPYIFENLKANYYSFNLNGMSHPGSGCRFDFTKDDYQHLYQNLMDVVGVGRENGGIYLTPLDFKTNTTLYAFSVDGDLCNNYLSHGAQNGTVTFQINMQEATPAAMQLVIYKVYDKYLTIDRERNCRVEDIV